jgi:hypothetical protein
MIAITIDAGPASRIKKRYRLKEEVDASKLCPDDPAALELAMKIGKVEGLLDALAYMHCIDASFSISLEHGVAVAAGTIVVSSNDSYLGVRGLVALVENDAAKIAADYPGVTVRLTADMTAEMI